MLSFPLLAGLAAIFACVLSACAFLGASFIGLTLLPAVSKRPFLWFLLTGNLAVAALASWQVQRAAAPPIITDQGWTMRPAQGLVIVTDRGRTFPAYRAEGYSLESFANLEQGLIAFGESAIRMSAADPESNCYGWVFTGGQYLLDGTTVGAIVADNGYEPVAVPRAGDLVVYRNDSRQIVHVGVVRCVLEGGPVLVESKWSVGGRYLHRPEDQCFSQSFAYYRTSRASHAVSLRISTHS